jgi:uncharacterized protein YkwD
MHMRSALLRTRIALVVVVAAIALFTTACFPNVAPGEPPDPYVRTIFRAINRDRANAGLAPLSRSPKLENLAGTWAWRMAVDNWLRHQDLGGLLRNPDFGAFYTLYENVSVDSYDWGPEQLEADWMNSPPHRDNILRGSVNVVGIGVFHGSDGQVWAVVDFGGI